MKIKMVTVINVLIVESWRRGRSLLGLTNAGSGTGGRGASTGSALGDAWTFWTTVSEAH